MNKNNINKLYEISIRKIINLHTHNDFLFLYNNKYSLKITNVIKKIEFICNNNLLLYISK